MSVRRGLVAGLTAAGLAVGGASGASAAQSVGDEERAFRQEALGHAAAVASAYRRLEEHILLQSTAITSWAGSTPPATVGWLQSWTTRGLRARYCDDTLLVYLDPQKLKGVGGDHRAVHAAPHAFVGEGEDSRFPALHWLEGGKAHGGRARPTVDLPACMTGDPLPSGRAALAGGVKDPFVHLRAGASYELRGVSCPSGQHGPDPGIREAREVNWREDGRGNEIAGIRTYGGWQVIANMCRADYSDWEYFTRECTWTAGPPHNREMTGEEVWKRRRTVTAAGTTLGTPVLESSSCWEGEQLAQEAEDTPTISEVAQQESMTVGCGQGFTGTRRYERTKTTRSTQFRWDAAPVVSVRYTAWSQASSSCAPVVTLPQCDPNIENCDGTTVCDPLVDKDCGKIVAQPDPKSGDPKSVPQTVDVDSTRTRACPSSMTGTYVETQTCRYTYQLSADGVRTQIGDKSCGAWWMSVDNCKPKPGHVGSGTPGTPGGGTCGPPGDGSASPGDGPCTGMDPGLAAAVAAATGTSGDGGNGGCYFTTAVVELRGDEPDDGPTLTALREFRDTYMMETPLRRAMVRAYYAIAPLVVRDLPADDPSWKPMGAHIDRSVALIRDGDVKGAFRAYVAGSARLMLRWWLLRAERALS